MSETPIQFKRMLGTFTVFLLLSIDAEMNNPIRENSRPRASPFQLVLALPRRPIALRIHNVGAEPILQLVAAFPEETVFYGDIARLSARLQVRRRRQEGAASRSAAAGPPAGAERGLVGGLRVRRTAEGRVLK